MLQIDLCHDVLRLSYTHTQWLWALVLTLVSGGIGCTSEHKEKTSSTAINVSASSSKIPSLLLGRVTSMTSSPDLSNQMILGHENGAISMWSWPPPTGSQTHAPTQSWVGHEGAVRTLRFDPTRRETMSVGADGSWATWAMDSALVKRHRALDVYANQVMSDQRGG